VLPTDDERLKIVIIPADTITSAFKDLAPLAQVQEIMANARIDQAFAQKSEYETTHLYIPSFKAKAEGLLPLMGVKLSDD
jgi:hypothetical protein